MNWEVMVGLATVVVAPWVGIIVLIVTQGHHMERIRALEEKMDALTGELGWKKE